MFRPRRAGRRVSTYVLVHGASHGGWCWRDVARALRVAGHEVYAPSLTGLADRSHLLSASIDVHTHIADIANLIRWEELTEVVLVGHSYGGRVITGVADQNPERISALVYLDASVPGLSDPWPAPADLAPGTIAVPPPDASLYGLRDAHVARVNRLTTPQPIGCFQDYEPTGVANSVPRRAFLATPLWGRGERSLATFGRLSADAGWELRRLEREHDMMIAHPEELASYLLEFAAGTTV